ncbi:MAG: hypothetical protein DHS20C05_11260 [Hyphococcus sp.]|nr:MAG: hypothetical protein DHS20C05_11260 [Marinicaulis sp.]
MLRPAKTIAEKMIKVDHAGENGAVNIYRAQRFASSLRARRLLPQLQEFQEHEEEHRRIFAAHLNKIGVRRCVSYHACGMGGFCLGLVTGLIGPNAVTATTFAVEHTVLKHLEEQLSFLQDNNQDAYVCVKKIYADEKAHHDAAENQLTQQTLMAWILVPLVKLSTDLVIRFGMR